MSQTEFTLMKKALVALSLTLAQCVVATPASRIAYWVYGDSHPETVVLIHGFNSTHETWDKVVPVLSKRFRVIVYDQPGHGLSAAEGKDFSPKRMATELKDLLEVLKIQSVHVVGHSMGGRTAMEFAGTFPHLVKNVLVEDMSALSVPESVVALPGLFEKFERVKAGVPDSFDSMTSALFTLSQYYTPQEIPWILGAAAVLPDGRVKLGNRPEVTALYLHQGLAEDMSHQLALIRAPLVFFAADPHSGSAVLKGKAIEHIHEIRPDVKVQVFKGASHSIHDRTEFTTALLLFLGD